MSISDNLKKFAADTAKIAAKKSGDVLETVKNKYSEFDITTEVAGLHKKLGESVYNGYKNDCDVTEEIKEICENIDEKLSELEKLKNFREGFSYSFVCPSCSKACEPGSSFCPHCGEKLS